MDDQLMFRFPTAPPAPPAAEVDRLVDFLKAAGETWLTAKQIAAKLDLSDRRIRQLAEHSRGRVISGPGCPGYRHIDHCSVEDLHHVAAQLESQGKAMIARANRTRNLAHSIIR